jgi:4-hydroxythreonine-4-phosphate dehydrogenase
MRLTLFFPMPKPCIAITSGEPAGIGPDIIASIEPGQLAARLVVIGDRDLIEKRARSLNSKLRFVKYHSDRSPDDSTHIELLHIPLTATCEPGVLNKANSGYVLELLKRACYGTLNREFDAMVTAPVQKDIINRAGISFSGHTEFLAEICGGMKPVMLLTADQLRVALVTTHLPLRKVADAISTELIIQIAEIVDRDLKLKFALDNPHIKVCGLNPHAGESGYLGNEEIEIISPAIEILRQKGLNISGPFPADTIFTPRALSDAEVILAMYHDQGLPVLKHVGFHRSINTTLGLPIVRTSVDHGTALSLAGSSKADPGSLLSAIQSAISQSACVEKHASSS